MPLFNVLVEVKTTYFSNIVVEAKNYPAAIGYCKNNIDWQTDDALEVPNAGGYCREFKLKETREIESIDDMPNGYRERQPAWNSNGGLTIEEYLALENTDNMQSDGVRDTSAT